MSGGYFDADLQSLVSSPGGKVQRPGNRFPTLVSHGGPSDYPAQNIVGATLNYHNYADGSGQFTILCNHNQGHVTLPGSDGKAAIFRFLKDHPYGTYTSPYAAGSLPSAFPSYCSK